MFRYSLGGLMCRFAIGKLLAEGIFDRVSARNFVTVATPHMGIRRSPRSCFNKIWNVMTATSLAGRSGVQMAMEDDAKLPLLFLMTQQDSAFVAALQLFQQRFAFANM